MQVLGSQEYADIFARENQLHILRISHSEREFHVPDW